VLYSVLCVHVSSPLLPHYVLPGFALILLSFLTSLTRQYCQLFVHIVSPVSNYISFQSYSHSHSHTHFFSFSLFLFFSFSFFFIPYANLLILHYPQSKTIVIRFHRFFQVINFRFSKAAREDTVDPETYIIDPGTYASDQIVLTLFVSFMACEHLMAFFCVFFEVIFCFERKHSNFLFDSDDRI
jgi:hypothetical protein